MSPDIDWRSIVGSLRARARFHAFGMPLDAPGLLDACNAGDRSVLSDERTAAFAAFGYASLRERDLAVLCLESGPSFLNALVALSEAQSAKAPVLAIIEGVASERSAFGAFQDLNIEEVCRALGISVHSVLNPVDVEAAVLDAAEQAVRHHSPVAVVIRVRAGSPLETGNDSSRSWSCPPTTDLRHERRALSAERAISHLISAAAEDAKIVVVIGGGVRHSSLTSQQLQLFARALRSPLLATASGRGAVSEDDPSFIGLAGLYATPAGNHALATADVIVFLASAVEETVRERWAPKSGAHVIVIDENPPPIPAHDGVRSDVVCEVSQFVEGTIKRNPPPRPRRQEREDVPPREEGAPQEISMIWREVNAIARAGEFDVVCIENGLTDMWAYDPRYFSLPRSASVIVCAEQAAMGAGLCGSLGADPHQKTLVICGDATLRMHLASVADAVEHERSIAYAISSNLGMGWPSLSREDGSLTTFAWNVHLPAVLSAAGVSIVNPSALHLAGPLPGPVATFFDVTTARTPWGE